MNRAKLIIFDLDGTLAKSKLPMDSEMADLLVRLIYRIKVAVISGGAWPQFETQFLGSLKGGAAALTNLYLLPTSGTKLYTWKGAWHMEYGKEFSEIEKKHIILELRSALVRAGYKEPEKIYGELIEDRGSQITFSALGQKAPIEQKSMWDPDRKKREAIRSLLAPKLPRYEVRIGGTTSVDITPRGVDKAYGIRHLEKFLNLRTEEIVFVGDALFPGGNDFPARATGVDCIQVNGPEEVKVLIGDWLG